MPMDKQLKKLQGRQLFSKSGSGQLVFKDEDSFLALESVQEAMRLSRESGIGIQVDFQEEMIAIHGRKAREVTIYFRVQEERLVYVGLKPPEDKLKDQVKRIGENKNKKKRVPVLIIKTVFTLLIIGLGIWYTRWWWLPHISERARWEIKIRNDSWKHLDSFDRDYVIFWLKKRQN